MHDVCTGHPLCCALYSIPFLTAFVCIVQTLLSPCAPPLAPAPPTHTVRIPACRASSIGPELIHCAPQVRPPPCLPACPPACFVCLPVCVLLLRTPAWSACMSGLPGLRAVHPALIQSSCAVHARCSHLPACLPVRPPVSYVCLCVCALAHARLVCLPPSPACVQSSFAVHARCAHLPPCLPACPPVSYVCMCVCCRCARLPALPASLTRLACVPCIQH